MCSYPKRFYARIPASAANIGSGFDAVGIALALYNEFSLTVVAETPQNPIITFSADENISGVAAIPQTADNLLFRAFSGRLLTLGRRVPAVEAHIHIAVPPSRGLGSSATAALAGILLANAYANAPQAPNEVIAAAAEYECGRHADNIAPAMLGSCVVGVRAAETNAIFAQRIIVPAELKAVLFIPDFAMDTAQSRSALPNTYSRDDAVFNVGRAALLAAALAGGNTALLREAMRDKLHEQYRAALFPSMPELIQCAIAAGAYGACLSGSGSSILALTGANADEVAEALSAAARALRIAGRTRITEIDTVGATVTESRAEPENHRQSAKISAEMVCPVCGGVCSLRETRYRCACGAPLDIAINHIGENRSGSAWRALFDERLQSARTEDVSGVWRFRELLLPAAAMPFFARPEGQTRLYAAGSANTDSGFRAIGAFAGLQNLWIKHEGENPTGSFKDRGMTMGVSAAKWLGRNSVACASTGNTSASMASYGAMAGLKSIVLLPQGKVAAGKLAQALAYGAEIRQISGDFDAAMVEVERMADEEGIYLLNSLNPFRILGQQSLAFELSQQFSWNPPDWVALPAGNLGNTSAIGAGFLRAVSLGLISKAPRIAAIQAAGANPFYQSSRANFAPLQPVKANTIATAINIGAPVSFLRAKAAIQQTNGVVEEVSDAEILEAKKIIDQSGIGCEPASAASVAGAKKLAAAGIILPGERVVCVLTGNLLKDPDSIVKMYASGEGLR